MFQPHGRLQASGKHEVQWTVERPRNQSQSRKGTATHLLCPSWQLPSDIYRLHCQTLRATLNTVSVIAHLTVLINKNLQRSQVAQLGLTCIAELHRKLRCLSFLYLKGQ